MEERRKKGTEEEEEEEQRWEWERQGRGLYKKRGGGSNRWGVTADQTAGGTACVRACVVVWFETRRPGRAGRRANAVGGGLGTAGEGGHASPVAGWRAPRRPARCPLVEPRAAASTHTQIKRTWNEKSRWWLVSWVAAVGSGRGPGPEAAVELSQDRGARQQPWQLACGDIYL